MLPIVNKKKNYSKILIKNSKVFQTSWAILYNMRLPQGWRKVTEQTGSYIIQ